MKTAKLLKEERALKLEAQQTLLTTVKNRADSPEFTEEETRTFDSFTNDIGVLDTEVVRAEAAEALETRMAGMSFGEGEARTNDVEQSFEGFNILRYLQNEMNNKDHEGPELAMRQFADSEARAAGAEITGIPLPMGAVQRAITAGGDGAKWIETLNGGFVEALRDKLSLAGLGAHVLGNLTGEFQLPVVVGGAASFLAETATSGDSGAGTDNVTMKPKRVSGTTEVSVQFMKQTSPDASRMFSNDLMQAIASAVNKAGVRGGGGLEPTGIINTTGVGVVAIGTNAGVPTLKTMVDLEEKVASADAEEGALCYLTSPKGRAKLKTSSTDAGSGIMVWGKDNTVNGYKAASSNHVPSDLTKGTHTDADLSAIIYGNFNDVVIGQWGVLDLIMDPFSKKKEGKVEITANAYFDVAVRRPASFAVCKDAITA